MIWFVALFALALIIDKAFDNPKGAIPFYLLSCSPVIVAAIEYLGRL